MNGNRTNGAGKYIVIAVFVILAALSVLVSGNVRINYDVSDYLDRGSETRVAMDIIEEEFGLTGNLQVMLRNIDAASAEEVADSLEDIDHVLNVSFDKADPAYYSDSAALFALLIDGDDYSDAAKAVTADVEALLRDRFGEDMELGGTAMEKQNLQSSITEEMVWILALSLALVVVILLITSRSWPEPFLLLASSGVAVLLNRGTNVMFGEISYITNSVAAILQLALSIDYSIILLHTYRAKREAADSKEAAMKDAVLSCLKPVSASALTTIAGLLALLFMSFRIGFDIGIVLMKGIVLSAVVAMTLFPALILAFDRLLDRTVKREFVPRGAAFAKLAEKAGAVIVPAAFALIVVCGFLQSGTAYRFTEPKAANEAITETFGENNTVVVIYPNSGDTDAAETRFADAVAAFRTASGETVLSDYAAYSNTVHEPYDIAKAVEKMELTREEAEMLFAMYGIYTAPDTVKLTNDTFVDYACELLETDADAADFSDAEAREMLEKLRLVGTVTRSELTAEEFYTALTTGVMEGTALDLFDLQQLYGLMEYPSLPDAAVEFETMLAFLTEAARMPELSAMFPAGTMEGLAAVQAGAAQLDAAAAENPAMLQMPRYAALYAALHGAYTYDAFLPALAQIAAGLSGRPTELAVTDEAMLQIYILYFRTNGLLDAPLNGHEFIAFVRMADRVNETVHARLTDDARDQLADMLTVYEFLSDGTERGYIELSDNLAAMRDALLSGAGGGAWDTDSVSGVFIKYAVARELNPATSVAASDLLDFVSENMDTNRLLIARMSEKNREKVADAQDDVARAEDLFKSEHYARMLLSVDLQNESADTTAFVEYLNGAKAEVFGEDAYAAGEICTIYDMQQTFEKDLRQISVFTIVAVFLIVMLIFRSLSLPVVLVAIIQGAIWIALSTGRIGDAPVFFMSYIVATCILMGATIDYGILMSSNYVAYRGTLDKKEALLRSLRAAMPTVFSSGLILTVCGFVIAFLSSHISISTVGLLIGKGALVSIILIAVVLPSVLYTLDQFILKLSVRKKSGVGAS